jgi:hypothetical protein
MGDDLITESKCRNVQLHIMLYDNFMDEIDYFVVKVYDNQYFFDTFACLD